MQYPALWKKVAIVAICLTGGICAIPGLGQHGTAIAAAEKTVPDDRSDVKDQPDFTALKEQATKLLDWFSDRVGDAGRSLHSGTRILVEVRVGDALTDRLRELRREVSDALHDAGIDNRLRLESERVIVEIADPAEVERAGAHLRDLARPVGPAGVNDLKIARTADGFAIGLSGAGRSTAIEHVMTRSLDVMRRRINALDADDAVIRRQGERRILISVPGAEPPKMLLDVISRTAELSFRDVVAVDPATTSSASDKLVLQDEAGRSYLLSREPILTGRSLAQATSGFLPQTGAPIVEFRLDTAATETFGDWTAANVGQRLAIVLDGTVITAPIIQAAIPDGAGMITGGFTVAEAAELALLLRSGALPAPIEVVEQRPFGPDSAADPLPAK